MAKYHLYIRAIPGYPSYYATVEGDILKKRSKFFISLLPLQFIMGIIQLR